MCSICYSKLITFTNCALDGSFKWELWTQVDFVSLWLKTSLKNVIMSNRRTKESEKFSPGVCRNKKTKYEEHAAQHYAIILTTV